MKLRLFQITSFIIVLTTVFYSCSSDGTITDVNAISLPSISTSPISETNMITALAGGELTSNGNSLILSRGVCYAETPNPTIEDSTAVNPGGLGTFECLLKDLTPNTQYFVKAYATNVAGTAYGAEVTFTTAEIAIVLPVITTTEAFDIFSLAARSGGNLISNGGSPIVSRGICFDVTPNPTINDNLVPDALLTTGPFESLLTDLAPSTLYYVRAYATNSGGTIYGGQISFTTAEKTLIETPEVATKNAIDVTESTALSGGIVLSAAGAPITARGICWSTTDNPSITDNIVPDSGTSTGEFTSIITGLMPGTTYFVKAFATNSAGTGYGDVIEFSTF